MNVPYLTYEEYTELGYKAVKSTEFGRCEREARRYLDYATSNRLKTVEDTSEYIESVKECMAQLVESWDGEEVVKSYNSGVNSFTFDHSRLSDITMIVENTLPVELYTWVI